MHLIVLAQTHLNTNRYMSKQVGKFFGCVNIDIEHKNISIMGDIGGGGGGGDL